MAVIVIVRFRLAEGVRDEQFLAESKKVELDHVSKQPGFASRETAHQENGEWLVVVRWESTEAANAAMKGFMDAPKTQAFLAMINQDSYSMTPYVVVE